MKPISVGGLPIGEGGLTIIAGPCLAESAELCLHVAETVAPICENLGLGYVFKASYDKANRSGANTPRGEGIDEGLAILRTISERTKLPVTTDIHLPEQAGLAAEVADLLQIPAFLCRQSDLLEAAARTGKPVNVKKGQFLAPWDTKNIVEKLAGYGASGTMLTERGTTFGYNALIVDMPGLETMRSFGCPVCFDATHSAQRPGAGGNVTGGVRESIPAMCRAAVAVRIDALFIETHPDPARAMSDAATQWPLDQIEQLLKQVAAIHETVRS